MVLVTLILLQAAPYKADAKGLDMTPVTNKIQNLLDEFENDNDINLLAEAIDSIESLEVAQYSDTESFRQAKMILILAAFNSIDSKRIVNFDFDDTPEMNVAPPPEAGLPPGVTVDSIRDPKLRLIYEKDIEKNQVKKQKYNFQLKLKKLNELLTGNFKEHIEVNYSRKVTDLLEIENLIDKVITSVERNQMLKTMLMNP